MTEDEKIANGIMIGNQTIYDFCGMDAESIDNDSALLALFQTAVTALRYRGWSESMREEHFALGLEDADAMLIDEGSELPEEPVLH